MPAEQLSARLPPRSITMTDTPGTDQLLELPKRRSFAADEGDVGLLDGCAHHPFELRATPSHRQPPRHGRYSLARSARPSRADGESYPRSFAAMPPVAASSSAASPSSGVARAPRGCVAAPTAPSAAAPRPRARRPAGPPAARECRRSRVRARVANARVIDQMLHAILIECGSDLRQANRAARPGRRGIVDRHARGGGTSALAERPGKRPRRLRLSTSRRRSADEGHATCAP